LKRRETGAWGEGSRGGGAIVGVEHTKRGQETTGKAGGRDGWRKRKSEGGKGERVG